MQYNGWSIFQGAGDQYYAQRVIPIATAAGPVNRVARAPYQSTPQAVAQWIDSQGGMFLATFISTATAQANQQAASSASLAQVLAPAPAPTQAPPMSNAPTQTTADRAAQVALLDKMVDEYRSTQTDATQQQLPAGKPSPKHSALPLVVGATIGVVLLIAALRPSSSST